MGSISLPSSVKKLHFCVRTFQELSITIHGQLRTVNPQCLLNQQIIFAQEKGIVSLEVENCRTVAQVCSAMIRSYFPITIIGRKETAFRFISLVPKEFLEFLFRQDPSLKLICRIFRIHAAQPYLNCFYKLQKTTIRLSFIRCFYSRNMHSINYVSISLNVY